MEKEIEVTLTQTEVFREKFRVSEETYQMIRREEMLPDDLINTLLCGKSDCTVEYSVEDETGIII